MVTLDQAGRAVDWTLLHPPPPTLHDLVELGWSQYPPASAGRSWRIVADTSAHLLVHGTRAGGVQVRIVGSRARWVDVPMNRRAWTAGVRLRPGGLAAITSFPASELTDRGEDAATVLGAAGERLTERVGAAASAEAAVTALFDFIEERRGIRSPDRRIVGLVHELHRRRGAGRLRDMAALMGQAERTLRQLCTNAIGLSPLRVARIARLHRSLELRLRHSALDWARIAVRAGYADQPHLIREFNALLGESPTCFMARGRTARVNGHADSFKPRA